VIGHIETTTRAFGWNRKTSEQARRVEAELRISHAWVAFVERYGPPPPESGYVWVSIDGGPAVAVAYEPPEQDPAD
jgi:hypothetical protein